MTILNIGCGNDNYGDVRIDFIKTPATTHIANIENGLPFESNLFDEVYSSYVWEHIKNPYKLLLEMKRVCKPNGKIIIITDNAGYIPTNIRIKALHGNHIIGNDKHYALYTMEHMRNFFNEANINILSNELIYWEKLTGRKSRILHSILAFIFGKRLWMPSVKIIGIKG